MPNGWVLACLASMVLVGAFCPSLLINVGLSVIFALGVTSLTIKIMGV